METREQVFYELLQSWRENEDSIISEGLDGRPNAEAIADQEMLKWLDRYDEAPSEPAMLKLFKHAVIEGMMERTQ